MKRHGHDLTSSQLAAAPRAPLLASALGRTALTDLGRRVLARTWEHGLPTWSWGEAVALVGMIRFARSSGEPVPLAVHEWLDRWVARGVTVEHVNDVAPGIAAVLAAADNRANLADNAANLADNAAYLDVAGVLAEWVETSPGATRAPNGAIEHWPDGVWADTAFMAGVFLGHVGAATGDMRRLDECGRQLVAHAEVLQSPERGLFAHGSHRGETIPCFWGRANAWWALAAVEHLELAEASGAADASLVERVRGHLEQQLSALAECQPDHGVWSVLVDDQAECAGIIETSAAAGLGAAMLRAGAVVPGLPKSVTDAGRLAVRGALAYIDDEGVLTRVSSGTVLQLIPFGYSVIRDDRLQLWGQGLALHAVAAAIEASA